jgi:hypothetical protein
MSHLSYSYRFSETNNTACTKMIGAVSSGHNGFENEHRIVFSNGTKQQIFKFLSHAQSHPHPLSRCVTLQRENGDSGAESVLCAAVFEA